MEKEVEAFVRIINRDDLRLVLNDVTINEVVNVISRVHTIESDNGLISKYLNSMHTFCNWIKMDNIHEIGSGFRKIYDGLMKIQHIYGSGKHARAIVEQAFLNSCANQFMEGITLIKKGLFKAFEIDKVGESGISRDQLARYILDEVVGLGRFFAFNKTGTFAFCSRITKFDKSLQIKVIRMLLDKSLIKKANTWWVLGASKYPIRILMGGKDGRGRTMVYFIYQNTSSEKNNYTQQIFAPIQKTQFQAA